MVFFWRCRDSGVLPAAGRCSPPGVGDVDARCSADGGDARRSAGLSGSLAAASGCRPAAGGCTLRRLLGR
jgi:hypothetical protein